MTTHLTQEGDSLAPGDEEEPELVLIDDDEFEAAHRDDEALEELDDDVATDGDEPEFSFEDELDEAIALDVSDEMDPGVEDADERMAPLFHSQHEVHDASSDLVPMGDGNGNALDHGTGDGAAALAAAAAATALATPALSKQEAKAEEKRQREALKRRKEIDKAASQDEKERQRDEKAAAVAAERAAAAAQKEAAEAEKREAAEAKKQAAEDKKQAAEDEKRAAAEAKKQAAEDKKQAAEDKKLAAEDQKRAAAEAKKQAAEDKKRAAEDKKLAAEDQKRAAAEAKVHQAEEKAEQKAQAKRLRSQAKESRAEAKRKAKRREEPIVPTVLTHFVVDEQPEWAGTQTGTGTNARLKHGTTRAPIVAMIVVLLVVAGVAAYAVSRSNPKAAPPRAAAHINALPAALASLISANTADVAYAQHVGGPIPADVNGGGSVDLAAQGSNLSVTYSTAAKRFPEQIIYDGSQAFYDLGAISHYVAPAYNWVSTDMAAGAPGSPGIGVGGVLADPSALVSLVQASAPSANEVGKVQLEGVAVTQYSIALDQAAVTHLLATPGLPAYVHTATATYTQLDEQVYVNASGQVSRIVVRGTYPESGRTVTASTTLDLSNFGNPVSVVAPPPSQVVSEQQFQASADRLAQAPTS